jgi:hypothetical protein
VAISVTDVSRKEIITVGVKNSTFLVKVRLPRFARNGRGNEWK